MTESIEPDPSTRTRPAVATSIDLRDIGAYDDEAAGVEARIVGGVQSTLWQDLTPRREVSRFGTIPTGSRDHAGPAATSTGLQPSRMSNSDDFAQMVATGGNLTISEDHASGVPDGAMIRSDVHKPERRAMTAVEQVLTMHVDQTSATPLRVEGCRERDLTTATPIEAGTQDVLTSTAEDRDMSYLPATSDAENDGREMASDCPTTTTFAAGQPGGVNHTPNVCHGELGNDANVGATTVLRPTNRP